MRAINLFNNWVNIGKDDGMEINHTPSVNYMFSIIPSSILNRKISFLDIGCGNGWVVRRVSSNFNCNLIVGIDGSENMIDKAISFDNRSKYINMDINNLNSYKDTFDVIFSMEVLYYLKDPQQTFDYIFNSLLKSGGCCIVGIDYYIENTSSLTWSDDLGVPMQKYSIKTWKNFLIKSGFCNVSVSQFGQKDNWQGTLILYGEKNNFF